MLRNSKTSTLLTDATRKSVLTPRKFRLALKFADSKIIFCVWNIKKRKKNPLSSLKFNFSLFVQQLLLLVVIVIFHYSTNYFLFRISRSYLSLCMCVYKHIDDKARERISLSAWEQETSRESFSRTINGNFLYFLKNIFYLDV